MPELAYQVVDVFTSTAYAGNPLAVVLDGDDLTTAQMQAVAREFNLSETVFPVRPPAGADYALRIFTPQVELPFAGHPSVGAAWVLHQLGRIPAGDVVQSCGAGLLPVTVDGDGAQLTGGPASDTGPVDADLVARAVGLTAQDLLQPPRSCGAGIDFVFAVVEPEALGRVVPDVAAQRELGGSGVSVCSWDGQVARTRVFPGAVGVHEDPATGSAALGFGVFLAPSLGDGVHDYVVHQGAQMGRPSLLTCQVQVASGRAVRTTVRGGVVPVASGTIRTP